MGGVAVHVVVEVPGVDGDTLDNGANALLRGTRAREVRFCKNTGHPLDGIRVHVAESRDYKRHTFLTVLVLLGVPSR